MPKLTCPCPLYCPYCNRPRSRDDTRHYCKTRNCQWQYGYAVCTLHHKDKTMQAEITESQYNILDTAIALKDRRDCAMVTGRRIRRPAVDRLVKMEMLEPAGMVTMLDEDDSMRENVEREGFDVTEVGRAAHAEYEWINGMTTTTGKKR